MLAEPFPRPSVAQLLAALAAFRELDQLSVGFLTPEQYHFVDIWLTDDNSVAVASTALAAARPGSASEGTARDRLSKLKVITRGQIVE